MQPPQGGQYSSGTKLAQEWRALQAPEPLDSTAPQAAASSLPAGNFDLAAVAQPVMGGRSGGRGRGRGQRHVIDQAAAEHQRVYAEAVMGAAAKALHIYGLPAPARDTGAPACGAAWAWNPCRHLIWRLAAARVRRHDTNLAELNSMLMAPPPPRTSGTSTPVALSPWDQYGGAASLATLGPADDGRPRFLQRERSAPPPVGRSAARRATAAAAFGEDCERRRVRQRSELPTYRRIETTALLGAPPAQLGSSAPVPGWPNDLSCLDVPEVDERELLGLAPFSSAAPPAPRRRAAPPLPVYHVMEAGPTEAAFAASKVRSSRCSTSFVPLTSAVL